MHPLNRNIGAYVNTANASHSPAAQGAGTRNGAALAINDTRSIVLTANLGATSGTPTTLSVEYKLQTTPDATANTPVWTDATNRDGNAVKLTLSAASSAGELDVNLTECCPQEATAFRFLETVSFTGGTSPTVLTGATVTRGPGLSIPA